MSDSAQSPAAGAVAASAPAAPAPGASPAASPAGAAAAAPPGPATEAGAGAATEKVIEEARAAARARVLKELGFEKLDDAKASLARAKELSDAQLTEQQRLAKQLEELGPKAKRADEVDGVMKTFADQEFLRLPPAMQKYVEGTAGSDPLARLRAITTARESGLLEALNPPAAAAAGAPAAGAPAAKAATTVAQPGPATPKAPGTLTAFEQHAALKASGQHMRAAAFAVANRRAIDATRPK